MVSTEIRDRLATIVEENYEDEWGYPPNGIFTDIADAILEEFNLARKYPITELFAERDKRWEEAPCPFDLLTEQGCDGYGCPCGGQWRGGGRER